MRALEARKIPIADYLEHEGARPSAIRKAGRELWYLSPLRAEKTASFKVDTIKNLWFDHGAGKGGNVIDLVCDVRRVTVAEALAILARIGGVSASPTLPISRPLAGEKEKQQAFAVSAVCDITHPALVQYLGTRSIPLALAKQHLKEVHFQRSSGAGRYFALGFPCGDGWDVRSPVFKGFVGTTKDITFLDAGDGSSVAVLEGFMDYLSLLAHLHLDALPGSVLILHSTAQVDRAITTLRGRTIANRLDLYLDHDDAGRGATAAFKTAFGATAIDKSDLYAGHDDLNAWWTITQSRSAHEYGHR